MIEIGPQLMTAIIFVALAIMIAIVAWAYRK